VRTVSSDFMSLDGVVQAPGGADEDTDGGFAHGGWSCRSSIPTRWARPSDRHHLQPGKFHERKQSQSARHG
jgi:hypothetical protein